MAKVTQAHLDARRQQIIDAANACFTRNGFHQATMQQICAEAQLSPGAVYRYFASKDEIIEAICEEGLQRSMDLIPAAPDSSDTLTAVNDLVDRFFALLQGPDFLLCSLDVELWAEALRNPRIHAILRRSFEAICQRFAGLVRESQQEGAFNPSLDAEAIAQTAISLFQGLILQKLLDPDLDVSRYAAVVKALFGGTLWQEGK